MTSPRLLRAYRETEYRARGVVVRIGRRSPLSGVFITAWNPYSRRMAEGWNHRMQSRLHERLRRFVIHPADGALKRWHEAHLLVVADLQPIARIARIFRQQAIVVVQQGRPARLVLLRT
jgi:hypothetical protein